MLLCPLMVLVVMGTVLFLIVRAIARSPKGATVASMPAQSGIPTQMAADGFWILSAALPATAVIHYYYWSGGARHAGRVAYQPGPDGRQFVYTGLRPDQVAIHRVVQDSDSGASDFIIPGIVAADVLYDAALSSDAPSPPEPPQPPAPPAFPSAY